jgi:hypothetical protein
LVEQLIRNQQVPGSNPGNGSGRALIPPVFVQGFHSRPWSAGGDVGVTGVAAAEAEDDLAADVLGADEAERARVAAGALVAVVGDDEVAVGLDLDGARVAREAACRASSGGKPGLGGEDLVAALADRLAGGAARARAWGVVGVLRAVDRQAQRGAGLLLGQGASVDGEAEHARPGRRR